MHRRRCFLLLSLSQSKSPAFFYFYRMAAASNDFYQNVYDVVRLIPPGRVTSYGAIARYLGSARSSRLVGWAMNASHSLTEPVPAHRVVNRIGLLSGKHFFSTPRRMQELLEAEGVVIKEDQVQDFDRIFWDPAAELEL
jgi:methylated-DNA-protein-cysteine methyltransferase-like protein